MLGISPRTLDMGHVNGFWQGVVEPELERKAEQHLGPPPPRSCQTKPTHPIPDHTGGTDVNSHAFPTGKRLRQAERELSVTHAPRNSSGISLCSDYNSHNGCRLTVEPCSSAHEEMKPNGLHRTAQAQMIRLGDLFGAEKIEAGGFGGFIHALGAADAGATEGKIAESLDHMAGGGVWKRPTCFGGFPRAFG